MRRRITMLALGASILVGTGTLIMQLGSPRKARAAAGCTVRDARGNYGFQFQGWIQPAPNQPFVPFAEVGRWIVDDNGSFRGASTFSVGGVYFDHTFTGTVQINPDCTGTSVVPVDSLGFPNLVSSWVILKPGEEIIVTSKTGVGAVNGRLESQQLPWYAR